MSQPVSLHTFIPSPWYESSILTGKTTPKPQTKPHPERYLSSLPLHQYSRVERLSTTLPYNTINNTEKNTTNNITNNITHNHASHQLSPNDATHITHLGHQWQTLLNNTQRTLDEQQHMLAKAKQVNASLHTQLLYTYQNEHNLFQKTLRELCLQKMKKKKENAKTII